MDIFKFIDNAALMLILSLLSINIQLGWLKQERVQKILLGILYGSFAVIAMEIPMVLQPGVIFDSRSVILSLAGLYAGISPRRSPGDRNYRQNFHWRFRHLHRHRLGRHFLLGRAFLPKDREGKNLSLNLNQLFIFGFVLHLILVVWFFTIPIEITFLVIRDLPSLTWWYFRQRPC
jgi:hypothetical protein